MIVACNTAASKPDSPAPNTHVANAKRYHLRGKVVSTNAATGEVMLDHEAIPGFMSAMTMEYKLKNPSIISELHPGDRLTAELLVSDDATLLDSIVITAQGKPDYKPPIFYHVPSPGDEVPDFKLLNEDSRQVHLSQYRGKALLITFIYTHCPLTDFCPRMGRNFAKIDKALETSPDLYSKTHLLSISFDPDHDTPAVLRSYGGGTTGKYTNETFSHWEFAAPSHDDLREVAKFFDVGVTPEEDHTITHSLSTTLMAPDGRVYKFYPGNDWDPAQVLDDIKAVLSGKS
jgi:protein SCO1/2